MLILAAALLLADPGSLAGVINAAQPGDTVRLAAGRYPVVTIRSRTFIPSLTIDASAASVGGVVIYNSTGIAWTGGTIVGPDPLAGPAAIGFGVTAQNSSNIAVTGVDISAFRTGIGFGSVTGGVIASNVLHGMSSDGIDVALSRNIVVDHNSCSVFTPAPEAHPDCIQLWSRPTAPPTADVTITNNTAVGSLQGISLFNHQRADASGVPIDDGGFDRVTIRGNAVLNTYPDGIAVYDCRGCTVRNNSVNSLPNYLNRAQLYVSGGSVVQCGNVVPMVPRQGTPPCLN